MFKVEVIGNLGSDAEIKNDNGRLYVQFSVADTRKYTKEDGTKQEVTNWISCFSTKTDAEVIKYLKRGTRVFVRGNGDLRVYSSAKDRMMKAGLSINVQEIELVGGSSDDVPRQLVSQTGQLYWVNKAYYVDIRLFPAGTNFPFDLFDKHGLPYAISEHGFVTPPKSEPTAQDNSQQGVQQGQTISNTQNATQNANNAGTNAQSDSEEPPLPF